MHGKRVVGCLNIIWIDSAMTFDTAVRRYLPLLRKAALRIETQYAQVFA